MDQTDQDRVRLAYYEQALRAETSRDAVPPDGVPIEVVVGVWTDIRDVLNALLDAVREPGDSLVGYMAFGDALDALTTGSRARRRGWPNDGRFVLMRPGRTESATWWPASRFLPRNEKLQVLPHLEMVLPGAGSTPWTPTQADMFARDWYTVPPPEFEAAAQGEAA